MTTKLTERYFRRRAVNGETELESSKDEVSSSLESDFPNSKVGELDSEHSVSTTDPDKSVAEAEQLSSLSSLAEEASEKDSDLCF